MPRKFELNANQCSLLSRAASRPGALIYPVPDTLGDDERKLSRELTPLRRRGLVELGISGLFVTTVGLAALEQKRKVSESNVSLTGTREPKLHQPRCGKTDRLLTLLSSQQGATINELAEATGWLPQSVRAALSKYRKKAVKSRVLKSVAKRPIVSNAESWCEHRAKNRNDRQDVVK